jgi:acyl-CoA thioester hydrolase
MKHQTRIRVRYAETDQMGVVYYANYLVWMEIGRVELVREIGIDYKQLEQREGLFLAVVESHCRYLSPARYDQEVEVETCLVGATPRSIDFGYKFRATDSERLIARGATRHVWLNRQMRVTRLPEQYLSVLTPHCNPTAAPVWLKADL